jgi:hypothetical protein
VSKFEGLYDIRPARPSDYNFILATFLRGLYYGDSYYSIVPKRIFMDSYKLIAQQALNSQNIEVKVACLKEDSDVILGYSVVSKNQEAVAWVFVKTAFRQTGIARSLIPSSPKYVTLLTALGKQLLPKLNGTVFNPFY